MIRLVPESANTWQTLGYLDIGDYFSHQHLLLQEMRLGQGSIKLNNRITNALRIYRALTGKEASSKYARGSNLRVSLQTMEEDYQIALSFVQDLMNELNKGQLERLILILRGENIFNSNYEI